jgi:hypothetical protein
MGSAPHEPSCERCGGGLTPLEREGEPTGGVYFGVCTACGHEQGLGIADPPVPDDWPHPLYVQLVLHWDPGLPDAKLLKALRALVPELAELPASQQRETLEGRSSWRLEYRDASSAEQLRHAAEAEGLRVEVSEAVSTFDSDHDCIPLRPDPSRHAERDGADLCPLCGERPGRVQPSQHGPFSDFACDECAANRIAITPVGILLGAIDLTVAALALRAFLSS